MRLDLRGDFADLSAYIAERVRTFASATNDGPGEPGPITMIEVGFEYAQDAWVAVVFDTRPDAEPDGEWTMHIEGNDFARPHWLAADEALMEGPITLVQLDGTEIELPEGSSLAEPLGELLKAVLLKARADGVFDGLPKTAACELGVEHHEGDYGWPAYEDRGPESRA